MKLHRLQRASDLEVQQWIIDNLELTPYQKAKLLNQELVR